ncbi:RNA polymerase sigma factor [Wenyingzhuangia sp. IMCC45533]
MKNVLCENDFFENLYKSHLKNATNFAFYKCGNQSDALDLVQEAFLNIWKNCAKIDVTKIKTYLFTSINHLFLNNIKHQKVVFSYKEETPFFDRDNQNPEYIFEENEYKKILLANIAALPEDERQIFLLNRIEGKKFREIAEILNISQKTVERKISKAIKNLNLKTKFSKS